MNPVRRLEMHKFYSTVWSAIAGCSCWRRSFVKGEWPHSPRLKLSAATIRTSADGRLFAFRLATEKLTRATLTTAL